jgi:hypothetical protein
MSDTTWLYIWLRTETLPDVVPYLKILNLASCCIIPENFPVLFCCIPHIHLTVLGNTAADFKFVYNSLKWAKTLRSTYFQTPSWLRWCDFHIISVADTSSLSDSTWARISVDRGHDVEVQWTGLHDHLSSFFRTCGWVDA